jgi:hypothetical protein
LEDTKSHTEISSFLYTITYLLTKKTTSFGTNGFSKITEVVKILYNKYYKTLKKEMKDNREWKVLP